MKNLRQNGGTTSPHGRVRAIRLAPLLLALGSLVLPLSGCSGGDEAEGAAPGRPGAGPPGSGAPTRPIPVSARVATTGSLQVTLRGSTNLRAQREVNVVARQGGIVSRVLVQEGARVREGDLLAELYDDEWRLQAQQSRARALAAAEAAQRGRALSQQDLVSAQEVERLVSDSAVAAADYGLADLRIQNSQIRAPIAGVITHRYVERGILVANPQGATPAPAFTIADLDLLEAQVSIPEREASRVRVGQSVRVLVEEGGEPIAIGRVERIRPVVDPLSGTVQVTVTVPSDGAITVRPGQFVNLDIVTEQLEDRITLPRTAVLVDGAAPRVLLIQDGRAVEREVTLGYSRGDQVEIRTGLVPGDTVIVVGQDNVRPSAPVRLMNLDGVAVEQTGAAPGQPEVLEEGRATPSQRPGTP